jgi:hypothetical protein
MTEPPVVPAPSSTTPPAGEEQKALSETLTKLTEAVTGFDERIAGIESQIQTIVEPPAPPAPPPPPEGAWVPKKWEEFITKAEEVAESVYQKKEEERLKIEQNRETESETIRTQIDDDFEKQIGTAVSQNLIPAVKDAANKEDAGVIARKELFALGIKYNTPDLMAMANLRRDQISAGYSVLMDKEHPENTKFIKSNPEPFGKYAPVGSSSTSNIGPGKPAYKDIHNLSMSEIVRRFNQ